jgi:hypothetical protein
MDLQEVSVNFDLEDVGPVLGRISSIIDSGFGTEDAESLSAWIARQSLDTEISYEYEVVFKGTSMPLTIVAFMDDVDTPDLAFFAPETLKTEIEDVVLSYLKEVGKW